MDPTARAALEAAAAADHRADQIDGLRELVAFLDAHPEVPVPDIGTIITHKPAAIAQFLDGLPDIELGDDEYCRSDAEQTWLVRWFGPVRVRALVPSAELGITGPAPVERPAVAVPSIDEARSRLCSKLAEAKAVAL